MNLPFSLSSFSCVSLTIITLTSGYFYYMEPFSNTGGTGNSVTHKNDINQRNSHQKSDWPTIGQTESNSNKVTSKNKAQQVLVPLPIASATNKTKSAHPLPILFPNDSNSLTTASTPLKNKLDLSQENQKPSINKDTQQHLQEHLNHWE